MAAPLLPLAALALASPSGVRSPTGPGSLPAWLPPNAQAIREPQAVRVLSGYQRVPVSIQTAEMQQAVATSFFRERIPDGDGSGAVPKLCFLHGADSSCLEWRYLMQTLATGGFDCTAVDWWMGGWTDRVPFHSRLTDTVAQPTQPWTLVRQHLHAFLQQEHGGEPVVLVGTSLGGAVAIDYATAHPDAVRALILIDAGGQSYKSPPPEVVRALAPVALAVKSIVAGVQAVLPKEELRINSLHRSEPAWSEAYGAYLTSGGYACQVGPELIRRVSMPTLVLWGSEDPILPLEDAYAFQRDLGSNCVDVFEIEGAGHSPHLDDPKAVEKHIQRFVESLAI